MKKLAVFDAKNYRRDWKRYSREAVRAIIVKGNTIALVKSEKEGYYKFPGGGIEEGETHLDTLIRETLEETGLSVLPNSVRPFGMTHEIRKSLYYKNEIFEQKSYYYFADVKDTVARQVLDDYEAELAYTLEWVDIETAYQTNMELAAKRRMFFLKRESYVLKRLLEKKKK